MEVSFLSFSHCTSVSKDLNPQNIAGVVICRESLVDEDLLDLSQPVDLVEALQLPAEGGG